MKVAVCVVTHQSADEIGGCLAAIGALEHRPLEIVVVDCASTDNGPAVARKAFPDGVSTHLIELAENAGFAGGMNAAIAATEAPFVLSLNPDARPATDYLDRLLARLEEHPDLPIAAITGRILRRAPTGARNADSGGRAVLDACGMRLTNAWRHLDRGSGESDRGQYAAPERVFGATGAASLFCRRALQDAAVDGDVFLPEFHTYREDAELAFRLQERGWEAIYEPTARALHGRRNTPDRRRAMSRDVNRNTLKNRYLLRLYHQTTVNALRTAPRTFSRDLVALAYVLLCERSSLTAYRWLWRQRHFLRLRRRRILGRRIVPTAAVDRWFRLEGLPL